MERLRRFLQLPPPDRHLLCCSALLLALIRLGLAVLAFRRVEGVLSHLASIGSGRQSVTVLRASPQRIAWAVSAASRYVPGTNRCLPQALAAQVMLVREGYPARLHIGVAKDGEGGLDAHAWVESRGKVIFGDWELERYARLRAPNGGGG